MNNKTHWITSALTIVILTAGICYSANAEIRGPLAAVLKRLTGDLAISSSQESSIEALIEEAESLCSERTKECQKTRKAHIDDGLKSVLSAEQLESIKPGSRPSQKECRDSRRKARYPVRGRN